MIKKAISYGIKIGLSFDMVQPRHFGRFFTNVDKIYKAGKCIMALDKDLDAYAPSEYTVDSIPMIKDAQTPFYALSPVIDHPIDRHAYSYTEKNKFIPFLEDRPNLKYHSDNLLSIAQSCGLPQKRVVSYANTLSGSLIKRAYYQDAYQKTGCEHLRRHITKQNIHTNGISLCLLSEMVKGQSSKSSHVDWKSLGSQHKRTINIGSWLQLYDDFKDYFDDIKEEKETKIPTSNYFVTKQKISNNINIIEAYHNVLTKLENFSSVNHRERKILSFFRDDGIKIFKENAINTRVVLAEQDQLHLYQRSMSQDVYPK
jgi:hypothetical protein